MTVCPRKAKHTRTVSVRSNLSSENKLAFVEYTSIGFKTYFSAIFK